MQQQHSQFLAKNKHVQNSSKSHMLVHLYMLNCEVINYSFINGVDFLKGEDIEKRDKTTVIISYYFSLIDNNLINL